MRVETANLDFGTGARADREHLAKLCQRNDLLILQETWNIRVASLLPPGWRVKQDRRDLGRANSAIAWRVDTVKLQRYRLRLGVRPNGALMRTRWIGRAVATDRRTGERFLIVNAHLPPARYSRLWPVMVHRLRRHARPRAVIGVDANMPIEKLAADLGLNAVGRGIIGILHGERVQVERSGVRSFGRRHGLTDHVTVWAEVSRR